MSKREDPRGAVGAAEESAAVGGRLKQSIAYWCFSQFGERWSLDELCQAANEVGCLSVELLETAEELALVRKYGLSCAIALVDLSPDPPFLRGFNNPNNWPRLHMETRKSIDLAARFDCPNVICFTGYSALDPGDPKSPHISAEEGAENCVRSLKEVIGYAEEKKVNLCLEPLNTRDATHPMKGHPGYQGDHLDYCMEIIRRVGSPRMKVLLDIYHTQVMDGDLIRHIREYKDYIGHIHTAGNPGRGELDDSQEIAYRPVMEALVEIGYDGYIGHEYIPTRDVLAGLREAVALCDV